jgi:predicted nucleic acid-binding protein
MDGSPVLVDSSFYIGKIRAGQDPLQALAVTALSRDLVTCGIVRCEVARGIRDKNILARFQRFWDVMIYVPTDNSMWQDIETTAWNLDRAGRIIPLTDVIIGCCARRAGAAVLTFDKHFYEIPGIRVTREV